MRAILSPISSSNWRKNSLSVISTSSIITLLV
jgi:hypothetical protein